jgi:hypothetical protein
MKKLFFTLALAFVAQLSFGQSTVYVNGYYRNDGTYVQPHYRTSPNYTVYDNWSTYPNVNPYTGQTGTKVYPQSSSTYYPVSYPTTNFSNTNQLFQTNSLFRQNSLFR